MSQAMRKINGVVRKSGVVMLFINQVRMDLGGMGGFGGQPREVTSGGKALLFYTSMRMDVRRKAFIKDGQDQAVGQRVKIEIKKNKVAVPYKSCEVDLVFGRGFDAEVDILDQAVACKIVDKAGAWYSFGKTRLGQGRAFSATFLRDNEAMASEIATAVRAARGLEILPEEIEEEEE